MSNVIIFSVCGFLLLIFFINSKKIANILKLFDIPDERKIHTKPVPLIGGLVILIILTIFYFFSFSIIVSDLKNSYIFLLAMYIISIVGIIDDKIQINPNIKFLFFITFFLIFFLINDFLVIEKLKFSSFKFEIDLKFYGIIFTMFCSLLLINAINMSDGINGLSAILQISIFIFLIYFNYNNEILTNKNLIFSKYFVLFSYFYIMTLFIFLIFNLLNKVFLGDGGSFLLSFILINSLLLNYKNLDFFYPENILMLLWLPGLDMLRLFIIRVKNKTNPFRPDQNHFHHILRKLFKKNANCLIYYFSLFIISNVLVINYPQHSLLTLIGISIIYFITIYIAKKKYV